MALITGASRGIGAAAALALAQAGAHVVLAARTVGGLEETDDRIKAAGGSATLVPIDLARSEGADGDRIDQLVTAIGQRFGRLDILVGNAAMLGGLMPVPMIEPKKWSRLFALNVTANWRLLRAADPALRASDAGRAIFLTSSPTVVQGRAFWGPYAASKAALESLVRAYAAEMQSTSVRANILDPGKVRTGMRAEAYPGENPDTLPRPEDIAPRFVELASPSWTRTGETVQAGAMQAA